MKRIIAIAAGVACGLSIALVGVAQATPPASTQQPMVAATQPCC
ncbi:hypothetical protein ACIGXM_21765 [Kitasatospora sp. NPDC052896]